MICHSTKVTPLSGAPNKCMRPTIDSNMRKYALAIAIIAVVYAGVGHFNAAHNFMVASSSSSDTIANAFAAHKSGVQVTGEGIVTRILPDDSDGSRHQRFILRLASGQTLLIAHNIDLAPRLKSLESGDSVVFSGVYEWNSKGGVVHWTHRDPSGEHQAGWLKHDGETVQ